jgi:quinol-cytochrome oxidoreductase complex cytochrome b subunit
MTEVEKAVKETKEKSQKPSVLLDEGGSKNLLGGLFDMRFHTIITTRMMPTIYGFAMLLSALLCIHLTVLGLQIPWPKNTWVKAVLIVLFNPIFFLGSLVAARIILEFILTMFTLLVYMERMSDMFMSLSARTESLTDYVEELPRFPFIRSWRSFQEVLREGYDKAAHRAQEREEDGKVAEKEEGS